MSHTTHETALLKMFYRHLPDITLITPVFDANSKEIIFFTASRGHHADIGGILPGSMPPTSVNIFEEGAEIMSFKIVDGGLFDQKGLVEYMVEKPSQYPGSSGCRNIRDVESDLKAVSPIVTSSRGLVLTFNQANCGKSQRNTVDSCQYAMFFLEPSVTQLFIVNAVVEDYGLKTVQEYMYHIRANAEMSVRNLLRDVAKRAGTNVLTAVDYLDDGSPVCTPLQVFSFP